MSYLVLAVALFLIALFKYVSRNPNRQTPKIDAIFAPADGKIITAQRYNKKQIILHKGNKPLKGSIHTLTEGIGESVFVVSIFMHVFNVHYNRIPYKGTVTLIKHNNGTYIPANSLKASFQNEKTETIITDSKLNLKVIQVAGFLARRIETFVRKGDVVQSGQLLGRINFGSQVTLILPPSVKLCVKSGDKVKAGESIIALPH